MSKNKKVDVENNIEEYVDKIFSNLDSKQMIRTNQNSKSKTIDELTKKWDMNDKIVELFKEKIKSDNNLKSKYAKILIWILVIQLLILNLFFFLKGIEVLNYSDTTFNIFITGGIAEIFLLVRIIVKYLFKDNLSEALNIILENNNKTKRKTNYNKSNYRNIKEE